MEAPLNTHIIQVTNIAPSATLEQMKELFGHVGIIQEIKLYPSEENLLEPQSKVCYIQYSESWSVGVAQHLTNTFFIDRALVVVPFSALVIPDESEGLSLIDSSLQRFSSILNSAINEISSVDGSLVITTTDPWLSTLGLPPYPPLPATMDPSEIEEIRRTVCISNLSPTITPGELMAFFNKLGEVKYIRMANDESQSTRFALVEFSDQSSVADALRNDGALFEGLPLKISHSSNTIVKFKFQPKELKTGQKELKTGQKELVEAMKKVEEASSLIAAVIEPELDKEKRRGRSRSRSSTWRRSRSRSRRKKRSSSRKPSRSWRRSISRHRTSRRRKRSRSTSKRSKRDKSRSLSRDRKKRDDSSHRRKRRSSSRSSDRTKRRHGTKSRCRSRSKSASKSKLSKSSKSEQCRSSNNKTSSKEKPIKKEAIVEERKSKTPEKEIIDPLPLGVPVNTSSGMNPLTPTPEVSLGKSVTECEESPEEKMQDEPELLFSQLKLEEAEKIPDERIRNSHYSSVVGDSNDRNIVVMENIKESPEPSKYSKIHAIERLPCITSSRSSSERSSPSPVKKRQMTAAYKRESIKHVNRSQSRSPSRHRSRSFSKKRSRSGSKHRSRSPGGKYARGRKFNSPTTRRKRSRSAVRRWRSPSYNRSSRKISRSPRKHLRSRRTPTPRRYSRSPQRRSITPRRRSRSPRGRSRSPSFKKRSRSPPPTRRRESRRSPIRRSRSPRRRSRSSKRESKHHKKARKSREDSGERKQKRSRSDRSYSKDTKVFRNYDEEKKDCGSNLKAEGEMSSENKTPLEILKNYDSGSEPSDMDVTSD